jgi:hypothetical protein
LALKRSRGRYMRIARYIKILLLLFLLFEGCILLNNIFNRKKLAGSVVFIPGIDERLKKKIDSLPDVFFIVFDGYTSSAVLKEDFDFDNKILDSLLEVHHFAVLPSSKSNYNLTPFSLGSVLNASYLKVDSQEYVINHKDLLSAVNTVRDNWIVPFLQRNEYEIKNFGVFDFKTAPAATYPYFGKNYFTGAIDDQTFFSRALGDIGWNFTLRNIFTGQFRVPRMYLKQKKEYILRNEFNYEHLIKELQAQTDKPRFVYCHMMLPHEPYYFNKDGSLVSDTAILLQKVRDEAGYIGQVQYSNHLLEKIIQLSSKNSSRARIVLIMGDHGYRSYPSKSERPKTFRNLNCFYSSDGTQNLYKAISPVNAFRFIMNRYFDQKLPFLKDTSIYLVDPVYDINMVD